MVRVRLWNTAIFLPKNTLFVQFIYVLNSYQFALYKNYVSRKHNKKIYHKMIDDVNDVFSRGCLIKEARVYYILQNIWHK